MFRSGDGHDHAEVSFLASNREMETAKVIQESGTTFPRLLGCASRVVSGLDS